MPPRAQHKWHVHTSLEQWRGYYQEPIGSKGEPTIMTLRSLLIVLSLTGILSCRNASTGNATAVESTSQEAAEGEPQPVPPEKNGQKNNNVLLAQHRDIPQKSPLEPANLTGLTIMSGCELWSFLQEADLIDSNDLAKLLAEQNFQQVPIRMYYWDFGDYSFEAEDYQGRVIYMRRRGDSEKGSALMERVHTLGDVGEITIADIEEALQIPGQLDTSTQKYEITTNRGNTIKFDVTAEGKITTTGSNARAYFDEHCTS